MLLRSVGGDERAALLARASFLLSRIGLNRRRGTLAADDDCFSRIAQRLARR